MEVGPACESDLDHDTTGVGCVNIVPVDLNSPNSKWVSFQTWLLLSGLKKPLVEIVLSLLIDSFKFSPSDKEIFWKMGGIARPTVSSPYNPDSQLPIMMELIE